MAALNAAAPKITDRLCDACAEHFAGVRAHLEALGVPYRLEPGLVRGLDYYTRTAFEFYVTGREGQQQAIGGGGRYDGLVELLGGRPTPGIGFGIGLDRLLLALAETGVAAPRPSRRPVAVVVGADPDDTAARLADRHGAAGGRDRGPGRARPAQARQAARGRGPRPGPFRGHRRRRAGERRGRPARPAGRHPEAGPARRPRPGDRARASSHRHGAAPDRNEAATD